MVITKEKLKTVQAIPDSVLDVWVPVLTRTIHEYGFKTKREIAAFLATLIHESAGFTRLVENLNYSAQGLARTWPNRYSVTGRTGGAPNALANRLHRKPVAIANNCYANRMGNGNEASGDGWRFRGHGPIQNTGRNAAKWLNTNVGKRLGIDFLKEFEKLKEPLPGSMAAAQYWIENVRPSLLKNESATDKRYMDIASDLVNRGRVTTAIGDAIGFTDRYTKFSKLLKLVEVPTGVTVVEATPVENPFAKSEVTVDVPKASDYVPSAGFKQPTKAEVVEPTTWGTSTFFDKNKDTVTFKKD